MRFRAASAACFAVAVGLFACAPRPLVRIPDPPAEVRKEAPLPQASPPRAAPLPPPEDHGAMYAEAIARTKAAVARGRAEEAIPLWIRLESGPWRPDALYHQGVLFHLAGDLDQAAERYRQALSASPSFESPAANLLGIHLLRGEREEMKALAARISPPGSLIPPDMLPELAANLGAALLETGRRDEADLLFRSLRARGAITPSLPWNMAVLAYRDGNRETAKELADGISSDTASLFPVVASRFAFVRERGTVPEPYPVPAGQPRLALLSRNLAAYAEYRKGDLEAAERLLRQAAADNAAHAELLANLGLLQMERGNWKEARESLERAVAEKPSMPEGWLALGIFREVYEGNAQDARECYENYIRTGGFRKTEVQAWIDWLPGPSPSSRRP